MEDKDVVIAIVQEEITFKKGYNQALRDVVRNEVVSKVRELWKPQHHNLCYGVIDPHPDCICCRWQAQQKEWGITNGS